MEQSNSHDYFLNVLLQFDKVNKNRQVTEDYVLNNIVYGLKTLFGEVGASFPINILKLSSEKAGAFDNNKNEYRIVVMCPTECAVKLRASLTLHGTYQGERCAYHILKAANSLLSLT
jgi:hypothetical protein